MLVEEEKLSLREAAAVLGVDHTTVLDDLKSGGNPPEDKEPYEEEHTESGGNPPPPELYDVLVIDPPWHPLGFAGPLLGDFGR